jgi:hypothetical protein
MLKIKGVQVRAFNKSIKLSQYTCFKRLICVRSFPRRSGEKSQYKSLLRAKFQFDSRGDTIS